jgi:hypothetical protein
VRGHVDATKHPIHIGDLPVTSDASGTAMVSEPVEIGGRKFHQPGTEILVLLSLQ